MVIIETPIFTKRIQELITDDEYRLLQAHLVNRPDVGKIMPGSDGLRKLRWSAGGRGKRGGIRVIYYWFVSLRISSYSFMPFQRVSGMV
jgi:mRNA-degrading endonuclease RelE of RelBE toxin-antitoxin system